MNRPQSSSSLLKSKHKSLSSQQNCQLHSNPIIQRKKYIQSFTIFHPLLDRLLQIKMAKCFQHGQVRGYDSQPSHLTFNNNNNTYTNHHHNSGRKVEAPSIQGSLKIFSLRPKTSFPQKPNYKPATGRPKTTNTIIRSRTCQPRVHKKLQMISKQQTQMQQQQLKPSIFISRALRRSIADPGHDAIKH